MRINRTRRIVAVSALIAAIIGSAGLVHAAPTNDSLARYLNLPLLNRDSEHGPGGVNPAVPADPVVLRRLLDQARSRGLAPRSYAALLWQYWLADTTAAAGIDLASWNPRTGVEANRQNLIRSYTFYEKLQLEHRELQWAGMGGQVGADFAGGLLDFETATDIFDFARLQGLANAVVSQAVAAFGPSVLDKLPGGLPALARVGGVITSGDLRYLIGMIMVMQKNIFSDLMPMHRAYTTIGLDGLSEMYRAGLFDDGVMRAWRDIASRNNDRMAAGNAVLLRREQSTIIGDQWDRVRSYKGDVGEAITYASTLVAQPSVAVAGVIAVRSYRPIVLSARQADGRTLNLRTPLPGWNWSVFAGRWDYISHELLPKYKDEVDNHWPRLQAAMRVPYDVQLQAHRPTSIIPQIVESALQNTRMYYS